MFNVIVIDDERHIADGLAKLITRVNDQFRVIHCFYNGTEAIEWLTENIGQVDLVVTDIHMPDVSGLDLVKKYQSRKNRPHFMILSGYNEFEYAQRAISYGVTAYLLKPVDTLELKETLNRISENVKPREENAHVKRESRMAARIREYVDKNYRDFDLGKLAEHLQMNRDYICRVFKRETGESINHYLYKTRMEKAARLLKENEFMKVYEISELVGYKDPIYFSRLFKKIYGKLPKEYQQYDQPEGT